MNALLPLAPPSRRKYRSIAWSPVWNWRSGRGSNRGDNSADRHLGGDCRADIDLE